eukprot:2917458-Pyramimonas_sp.AAC.1
MQYTGLTGSYLFVFRNRGGATCSRVPRSGYVGLDKCSSVRFRIATYFAGVHGLPPIQPPIRPSIQRAAPVSHRSNAPSLSHAADSHDFAH